jgi:hypothetical protein
MRRSRWQVPSFELKMARVLVTILGATFDGGSVLQRPPYVLLVELPSLGDRECNLQLMR